jgi:hypothetical protein
LRQMTLRIRTLFQRNRVERELEEEFQFHLEQRIELEIARGVSPEEARSAARFRRLAMQNRNPAQDKTISLSRGSNRASPSNRRKPR